MEVALDDRLDRPHLVLRLALSLVLGWLGFTWGWLALVLYGGLPVLAAEVVSARGGAYSVEELGPRLWRYLTWFLQLGAFMSLLTDRLPGDAQPAVRIAIEGHARPTVTSALARLLRTLPSAVVLCLINVIGCVLWLVAAVLVLVGAHVPAAIRSYQLGALRWQARMLAYHASLIDAYPPMAFDVTDIGIAPPTAGAGATA